MAQLLMRRPHLRDLPSAEPLAPGYHLREYGGPADLPGLLTTLAEAFAEPWDAARAARELTAAPTVKAIYVVTADGAVIGTASSRLLPEHFPGSGYVHWIGVAGAHRRRGVAAALLARVLDDFRERGCGAAVLETDDFRLPAIRAYLRCGFLPVYDVAGEDHRDRWSAIAQRLFSR